MKARQGNKKKYEEAFMSLCKLRHTKLQAGRDLFLIDHLLEGEETIMQQQKPFSELFTLGRNRRALTASVITMFLQQFCGVNVTVRTHHYSLSAPRANIPGLLLQHDPHPARWLRPSCRPPHLHGLRHHQLLLRPPRRLDHRHLRPPQPPPLHLPLHGPLPTPHGHRLRPPLRLPRPARPRHPRNVPLRRRLLSRRRSRPLRLQRRKHALV